MRYLCFVFATLFLTLGLQVGHAADSAPADTMIILDASGSMWGEVSGETKIAAARKSVRLLLENWPAARKLGLTAYGHRRKGDCSDIETIAPIGTIDAAALADTVDKLGAKGKTPIADALTHAAGELKTTETRATIILVSDGIETCGGDPCAVARALEEAGVDFTAHVIGFDVADPAAVAQLKCIADVSGGSYRDARNGADLNEALKETIGAEGGAAKAAPAPVEEDDASYNLRGVARLSAESDPQDGNGSTVTWRILSDDAQRLEAYSSAKSQLYHQVEPGKYIVEVSYGEAKAEAPAVVEAGKISRVDINLQAGLFTATLTQAGADPEKKQDLTWEIFNAATPEQRLVVSYDEVPDYVLPAGSYVLKVKKDRLATATQTFDMAAGDTNNLSVTLVAGTVRYKLPDAWAAEIRTPGADSTNLVNIDPEGENAINPGDYMLRVRYEDGQVVEKLFTIADGQVLDIELPH